MTALRMATMMLTDADLLDACASTRQLVTGQHAAALDTTVVEAELAVLELEASRRHLLVIA
jgi:hypothetical protein